MNLSNIKKIYFIGIKGAGTSSLACFLFEKGFEVLGSDTKEKFYTDKILADKGIKFFENFSLQVMPPSRVLYTFISYTSNETKKPIFFETK